MSNNNDLLAITVQSSMDTLSSKAGGQLLYLLVQFQPQAQNNVGTLPLNLSLVIDCSTSMKGERLRSVKNAAASIVERLGNEDQISVIAFNDHAEVVRAASLVNSKATLISHISSMQASGGTEIYKGLEAAYGEIRKSALDSYNNHIIVLTDGHTYGDMKECLRLARDAALLGVDISAFGIGDDWNDHFLDKLVALSGGESVYIEHPAHVLEYLQGRIKGLSVAFASKARLVAEFPRGFELLSVFKVAPYAQRLVPDGLDIRLGSIERASPLIALLEFQVEVQDSEDVILLPIKIVADINAVQIKNYSVKHDLELRVSSEAQTLNPPEQIVDAVKALNIYRMNERIWLDIEEGDIAAATRRMQSLRTRLLDGGYTDLANKVTQETEHLQAMGSWSESIRKRLKYGTRALLTQTTKLKP